MDKLIKFIQVILLFILFTERATVNNKVKVTDSRFKAFNRR